MTRTPKGNMVHFGSVSAKIVEDKTGLGLYQKRKIEKWRNRKVRKIN